MAIVIGFDGPDGAGKGTAIAILKILLEKQGLKIAVAAKEVGLSQLSMRRATATGLSYGDWTEMRRARLAELRSLYDVVLLDRSYVSEISELGFMLEILPPEAIWEANWNCRPDISVVILLSAEECHQRCLAKEEFHPFRYFEDWVASLGAAIEFLRPKLNSRLLVINSGNSQETAETISQLVSAEISAGKHMSGG